ncbi:heat shock protein 82-like [Actinidia eriantha]|uniref:heat shock protein 82-like n=1 Tax=Actinidia eriantha TaxID=165200 RepID=UPI0025832B51|nr:heat shock protein 82-like [Actinidia eriantha]
MTKMTNPGRKKRGDIEEVDEAKRSKKDIYYTTSENRKAVENSRFLERLKKNGYEVLYMVDAIDEYAVGQLKEYNRKKLVSATKEGLKLDDKSEEKTTYARALRTLLETRSRR